MNAAVPLMAGRDPTVLMVAGETSADLHGAKVLARLLERSPSLSVYGVGGDRLAATGMEITYHARDFAVVGFVEVVRHVPRLLAAMDRLVALTVERRTRLAILMDYPGFNLLLAKRLHAAGVRVLYYISPQVWAWGEGRVRAISKRVDRMAVVFEFERDFYRERGVEVEFVGHPLLEEPVLAEPPARTAGDRRVLGLLPGSRVQEVRRHLPVMLGAAALLRAEDPSLSIAVSVAPGIGRAVVEREARRAGFPVEFLGPEGTYGLMLRASALLVSSGTATLEAACLGAPMAVVYRMAPLSYAIARSVVRTRHIGLVNLVAGEGIVPELVQGAATAPRLAAAVRPFLTDPDAAARVTRRLAAVRDRLGSPGASDRVARMAFEMLGAG